MGGMWREGVRKERMRKGGWRKDQENNKERRILLISIE